MVDSAGPLGTKAPSGPRYVHEAGPFAAHGLQPIFWQTNPPRVQTSGPSWQQRPGSGPTWTEVQVVMTLVSYMVLLSLMSSGKAGLFSVFGGRVTGSEGFLGEKLTSVPLPKAWMAFPGGRRWLWRGCIPAVMGQGEGDGDGKVPYGDRDFP